MYIIFSSPHRKLLMHTLITALSSAVDIDSSMDSLSFTQGWYAVKSISVIMYIDSTTICRTNNKCMYHMAFWKKVVWYEHADEGLPHFIRSYSRMMFHKHHAVMYIFLFLNLPFHEGYFKRIRKIKKGQK